MRYAIFTDVHANLEALEAVLASIDELARDEPIDQIWFLGDLVGYGPNPNECIQKLRERTDVIIAGNHDWAAVGKISLDDFSEAARISAEWTAEQLTEEHRQFLCDLPEHIDMEQADCVLVHGSPYGPLWEYLTSEVLAERSFDCFVTRYCFVGHT
ncbi:MAG: metallophosphoesterase, partial [Ktedonobacteraceae bacterium]|nr:metallophosphoesterase [Ktedonobacteraceae bacterium]